MTRVKPKLAACLVSLLLALPALAQDDEEAAFDRTPRDCILTSNIRQTEAVDDQNVLFFMRDRTVYRNHLPRKCPGLEREDRFSYRLEGTRRLCSINTITIIEDSPFGAGVGGLRDGFTCRLGEFVPLSPEEVEDLVRRDDDGAGRRTQSTIETREVELPAREDSEAPADAAAEPADE